jgi:hypothetical protein
VRFNLKIPWSAVVAVAVGVVVVLGYFIKPAAPGGTSLLTTLRDYFLQIGVLLAAVAMLLGLVNLARVHWSKVRTGKPNRIESMIVLITLAVTFLLGTLDYFLGWMEDPEKSLVQYIFRYVQVPVERSLMALLAVALAYAAIRMLGKRTNLFTGIFLVVFLVVLIGTGLDLPYISDTIRPWVENVWAIAGMRGLLLGVGLGTLAAGLRVLSGVDRPYGG